MKSLRGERVDVLGCTERGIERDRWWSLRGADGKFGSGKTTRRFRRMPGLLSMSSFLDQHGHACIRFADGCMGRADDPATARRISRIVGEPVTLSEESHIPHLDDGPIHLLTSSSLRWLGERRPADHVDPRRFRPNLVIDNSGSDLVEDWWVGKRLLIGDVVLTVEKRTVRCVMTTQAQDELPLAPAILKELELSNELCLGAYATVTTPGLIRTGDDVVLR